MEFRIAIEIDVTADDREGACEWAQALASDLIDEPDVLTVHTSVGDKPLAAGGYLDDAVPADEVGFSTKVKVAKDGIMKERKRLGLTA